MILKFLLEFSVWLLGSIFSLVTPVFSSSGDSFSVFAAAMATLFTVATQTNNFLYFIFGDYYSMALSMVAFILPLKFVVVPIISFIRKLFVWGGAG